MLKKRYNFVHPEIHLLLPFFYKSFSLKNIDIVYVKYSLL